MLKGNLEKNKNWTWAIENTSSKAIMGYTYLKKSQRLREKYFFEKLIMHQPIMNERWIIIYNRVYMFISSINQDTYFQSE